MSSVFLSSAVLPASLPRSYRRFTATIREHKIEKRIRCVIPEMSDTVVSGPANDKLVGTWKLVSASSKRIDRGAKRDSLWSQPCGFLTYTADGRVTALISYGGRKPLSVGGGVARRTG